MTSLLRGSLMGRAVNFINSLVKLTLLILACVAVLWSFIKFPATMTTILIAHAFRDAWRWRQRNKSWMSRF